MKDQKGYLVEVQGFTPGRGDASIQQSQHLADSVVRYLVIHHQVPVYRIYELGLGNATIQSASGERKASLLARQPRGGHTAQEWRRRYAGQPASATSMSQPR